MQNYTVTPNALCKQLVLYQQTEGAADGTIFGVNNWKGLTLEMIRFLEGHQHRCRNERGRILLPLPMRS